MGWVITSLVAALVLAAAWAEPNRTTVNKDRIEACLKIGDAIVNDVGRYTGCRIRGMQ